MTEPGIDRGLLSLKQLVEVYGRLRTSDASEADTRVKVIDSVLRGVLYWHEDDLTREERASEDGTTQFVDYVLRTASLQLLVEAKRAGVAFSLPTNRQSGKLNGWLASGEIGEAIRQARDYCRKKSIPFAVVTNGSAWIVFPAVRTDGVPFEDGHARVFRSLEDILDNRFVEFWELLSRQRVAEGNLETELLGRPRATSSRRLLSQLSEPGYRLGRNALFTHIERAVAVAMSDEAMLESDAVLTACYVKTSERVKFDSRLKMYLSDARPPLGRPSQRVGSRRGRRAATQLITNVVPQVQRSILVLGPVGVGKSTFLAYTKNISGRDLISGKLLWFYIDFKQATATDSARQFIYRELLRLIDRDREFSLGDWEHTIRPAYKTEIEALERGALQPLKRADPAAFETKISEMIFAERTSIEPYVDKVLRRATQKTGGYLVIDNVDQIESDEVQSTTFLEAQAIARRIGINVIMSLRDATYLRHKDSPVFDAFQVETLFIDPPGILPVLSRRLAYARKLLRGQSAEIVSEQGARVSVDDLGVFFDVVGHSMLADDAGFMLDVLSGGDMRRGILLAREFLASGHTNADRALQAYLKSRSYRFPPHEIFKGAVLGQRKYFREEESRLLNVLDAKLGQKATALLRLHATAALVHLAVDPAFDGLRFSDVTDALHRAGVPDADVTKCFDDLLKNRVVRTADGMGLAEGSVLLPTRLAGFLVTELASNFTYLEMCTLDAAIFDQSVFEELAGVAREGDKHGSMVVRLGYRLETVASFLEYLQSIEEAWLVNANRRQLPEYWSLPVVSKRIIPEFKNNERTRVLQSAERMLKRGRRTQ